jgi:hypothetical protein
VKYKLATQTTNQPHTNNKSATHTNNKSATHKQPISHTNNISPDRCSPTNYIKHPTQYVNNTSTKCPTCCHNTPVHNAVQYMLYTFPLKICTTTAEQQSAALTDISMCRLSAGKTCSAWTDDPWSWARLAIPNCPNGINTILCTISQVSRSQNVFSFSVSFHQNAKWCNVFCNITLESVSYSKIRWLKGEGIGPALSTERLSIGDKVSSSQKTATRGFRLQITHKQNPHIEINQLAETVQILSQPGIQLCVTSVAVQYSLAYSCVWHL